LTIEKAPHGGTMSPILNQHWNRGENEMKWIKPELVEINMNAEIGGYQGDTEEPEVPFIAAGFEVIPAVLPTPPVELSQ
jgi:hypothetical protein